MAKKSKDFWLEFQSAASKGLTADEFSATIGMPKETVQARIAAFRRTFTELKEAHRIAEDATFPELKDARANRERRGRGAALQDAILAEFAAPQQTQPA